MANEYRASPVSTALASIYGRFKRPSDGARWNGLVWNELGTSALSAYSRTLTRSTHFEEEVFADRPGGIAATEEVVLEVLSGVGASPTSDDALVCAQVQGPGVEDVIDQLGEIATDLGLVVDAVEEDLITADAEFCRDTSADDYVIQWRRNAAPLTSGVSGTPTIEVHEADGSVLVAQTAMTTISTGRYRYSEATDRLELGDPVEAIFKATIDGEAREVRFWFKRDAAE